MASPKPNYTCRLSLLAAITSQNIRESVHDFAATIGEIITDMSYLCELGGARAKRAIFLFFPPFEDKLRLKTLNLRFSAKKQVNF